MVSARAKATQANINVDQLDPATLQKWQAAQGELAGALSKLMVVSERYPDLKADGLFRDLTAQLEGTENRIAIARRRYIESVVAFNDLVTVPPTSWTNAMFYHYAARPQFAAEDPKAVERPPEVAFE